MKSFRIILLIILATATCSVEAQKSSPGDRVKCVSVYQERYDVLIRKQYKVSETCYDKNGNVVEEISYKQGREHKHHKYEYDGDNNKIREEKLDPSGKVIQVSTYKYANGLRIEKTVTDAEGKIKSIRTYKYTNF